MSTSVSTGERGVLEEGLPFAKRCRIVKVAPRMSQLIGYDAAPDDLASWLSCASATVMSASSEAGRRFIHYNVKKVAAADVQSSDLGVVAVEQPDEGEARDGDFMASVNLLFFEFLGTPGSAVYFRCFATLEEPPTCGDLMNRRFTVAAPTHFLIADNDFSRAIEVMRLGGTVQPQLQGREKAADQRAPDMVGERSDTGEKGIAFTFLTRDGRKLPTRDKTNIGSRCDQLEFMWRAAEEGLWKHISGSGYKMQASTYWKILQEEAEALQQPAGSVFERAGKLSLIADTEIARDHKKLEMFLSGEFGEAGLSLESFCVGIKLPVTVHPCVLHNQPLISALEALGTAMEIMFSPHFAGVCNALVEALRGHERPLRLTGAGFLIYTVELEITKFFRTVSKEDRSLNFPNSDIKNPAGCASLLRDMLDEAIARLVDVGKATLLEKNYMVNVRLRSNKSSATSSSSTAKTSETTPRARERVRPRTDARPERGTPSAERSTPAKKSAKGTGSTEQCGAHLGGLLGAVKANGKPLACHRGDDCKFVRGGLSDLTKAAAESMVSTMPPWMQECISPRLASSTEFKK